MIMCNVCVALDIYDSCVNDNANHAMYFSIVVCIRVYSIVYYSSSDDLFYRDY